MRRILAGGTRSARLDCPVRNSGRNPPRHGRRLTGGGIKPIMFDKASLDRLFEELRDEFELETDWEEIQRDAHLAVAYADAGVLDDRREDLDARILDYVARHNPN